MNNGLNRLELTWIGKEHKINPEPRILLYDEGKSYGDQSTENMLIHGDNVLALKALELEYAGKIKCIYADVPYNTGTAFEHYDDNLEHSLWLNMMKPRLELLRGLLSYDGSIWISIDDDEGHYLKVLCDEVFGRSNYKTTISWQRKYSVSNNYKGIARLSEFVLVYSKSPAFTSNLLPRTDESTARYANPDNDPRGAWKAVDYLNQATTSQRPNLCYDIINHITGAVISNGVKAWKYDKNTHQKHVDENRLWWGLNGENTVPALKLFLSEVRDGMTPHNWWSHEAVGHTDEAKKESIALFGASHAFSTPKPERLIERILTLATNPGDLVLDSFLGSGTTAAVAHKMNRRWIGIELGDHCYTHCAPRMKAVIDGEQGGISKSVNWQGGGGYRFMELADTLLTTDKYGHLIINPQYNAEMLAAAMAKHKGYRYNPDQHAFWKQGRQGENNYIYTTTMFITPEYLDLINLEMADGEHLLICCESFNKACNKRHKRIIVQKIPKILLGRCEFGKDSYELNVLLKDVDREVDAEGSDDE